MTSSSNKPDNEGSLNLYLPGLNELRALAALSIIPGHIEEIKQIFNFPNNYWFPIPGKLGVVLFFALSGFLITTLLINEKAQTNQIDLKRFYFKRILRIWPLYFLIMGLCILVINRLGIFQMPNSSSQLYEQLDLENILLILLIMPNFSVIVPYAGQSWSIGTEMQFYLVQPFIIKIAKNTIVLTVLMFLVVFLKEILLSLNNIIPSAIISRVAFHSVYFGCIAIGCLGAILCKIQPKYFDKIVHNWWTQLATFILLILVLILIRTTHNEEIIDFRYHAILFTIVIINASRNPLSFYNLNNSLLNYLGKISYGIYMYHPICIGVAIVIGRYYFEFFNEHIVVFDIFIYSFSVLSTIIISSLSFKYLEGYFLSFRLKSKNQAIPQP